MTHSPPPAAQAAALPAAQRHTIPTLIASALLLASSLGYGAYWTFAAQYREFTEDAYVEGNVVQVTTQTSGTVTEIGADNTDLVAAGEVLLRLNPADAHLALQRAEAQLAKAVRQVRGQFSAALQMQAHVEARRADLSRAAADLERRAPLVKSGAVSAENFRHAEEAVRAAQAALTAAEQQFAGNQAQIERVSIADHPDVVMAAVQLRDAQLAAARTELRAPVSGMVTRRNVQVGQRVSPGTPLLAIVPLDHLWVSANFKESQLRDLRIGQPVRLSADVYGRAVEYRGQVLGADAGTGSAFALLPAQNATGNWIKVVQRVPVRIALDAAQLAEHPLRIGLSMQVEVDTRQRAGQPLALAPSASRQAYATRVFAEEARGVEARIKEIIRANLIAKPIAAGSTKS